MMQLINGHKCFFEHSNKFPGADTVIFLNGILFTVNTWQQQADLMESMGLNVLRYDLRGQWFSETTPGPYTMELLAQDLAALMDHCGIEKAHLVSTSYGGFVTQQFASMYPEKTKSIFMMTSSPNIVGRSRKAVQNWCHLNELGDIGLYYDVMTHEIFSEWYFENHEDVIESRKPLLLSVTKELPDFSLGQYNLNKCSLDDLAGEGLIPLLSKITCPAHFIAAEDDIQYPPRFSQIMSDHVPQSEITIIPKYGHAIVLECKDKVNKLLKSHIEKHAT